MTFVVGLLIGAAVMAILLLPRLRERESAHQRQLAELRAATDEKIALVSGNREQLAAQMKAISADTLRQVSEQLEKLEGLRDRGSITPEQYEAQKAQLLGG